MARHAIGAEHAFTMLREHSEDNGVRLIDVAEAIIRAHLLLVPPDTVPPDDR